MIRLFLGPIEGETCVVAGEAFHYLTRVMRLPEGAKFVGLDGTGQAHTLSIETLTRSELTARVVETHLIPDPPVRVRLYQALPKADKFEWIIQKATELGVDQVVPLVTAHAVVQLKQDKIEQKLVRWRKVAQEAAEQSERGRVPEVETPRRVQDVQLAPGEWGFILAERGKNLSLTASLPPAPPAVASLFIGPEGGWASEEIQHLKQVGAHPVTLGPRILRTETAALAAVALTLARYEL